jgi:hypothetical protein
MSGVSVDNLSPNSPTGFRVAYQGFGAVMHWEVAEESDFYTYKVFRGLVPDFSPAPGNMVAETSSSRWIDPAENSWQYHYLVTSQDFAGNQSPPSSPSGVSGQVNDVRPTRFALHDAFPNPFNPYTKISFEIPGQENVSLYVFDIGGHLVGKLFDAKKIGPGSHQAVWDGKNDSGQFVASGTYFYRFEAGSFTETKRMVLIK